MSADVPAIHGTCSDRFAPVRAAFEDNFASKGDVGACVAVSVDGELVVDLWGGVSDVDSGAEWQRDTIINVYSSTKTMAAMSLLLLADRGEVDLTAPAARYWPEFAANGKAEVAVSTFLSHSAGLSGMDEPCEGDALYDWEFVTSALARQAPWWEPGTASGYHALTQGHLIGEIVRRVSGQTIGEFFAQEIATPLADGGDFFIGTPESEFDRIGALIPPDAPPAAGMAEDSIAARTFSNPRADATVSGSTGWRKAEIPAANGHGNARGIVNIQSLLACGGEVRGKRLMSEDGCRRIFDVQTDGEDLVLGVPITFGMGYGLSTDLLPMGPNKHIAYWGGWGGSTVVIDLDARMAVSYVMNRMEGSLLGDTRGFGILQAAYQSLAS